MKKLITLLLLFILVGFLSANQVIITNDYQYIVSTGKTYNFNNGNPSNNIKYDRTNKIQIQNNKVIANPLKYHYAFFWQEDNTFIGYYKTNKGLTTSGAYLGQVNTQSIPLPLNAYSFALVRYDNDYVLVNGYTIEELFIDNNLAGVNPDDFNDIPIAELNGLTLNEVFDDGNLLTNSTFDNDITGWEQFGATSLTWQTQNAKLTFQALNNSPRIYQTFTANIGDQIYVRYDALINDTSIYTNHFNIIRSAVTGSVQNFITYTNLTTNFQAFTGIISAPITGTNFMIPLIGLNNTQSSTDFALFDNIFAINLTVLGLTSLTQSQLDTYFSIYQNGVNATYYATDGNVSSVDGYYFAAGKNLFDGVLEIGFIDTITGLNGSANIESRTINFIKTLPNQQYSVSFLNSGKQVRRAYFYDIDFNYLGNADARSGTFTTLSNTNYLRLTPRFIDLRNLTTLDILELQNTLQLEEGGTATAYEAFATPTTTLNLTFLFGIGNEPDKATMDGYYAEYEEYLEYLYVCCNIFATQTISFETIYFDDGVSTEIQRLGSILIFTLIGFTLMIFGFVSRRRIFNLLSIGAFIVLGFLLIDFVGFIIILFGLVFINVYYTFFGEL